MLDKMFGVSPPLKGEAPDSKLAVNKAFRENSKDHYRKDFEKALAKKLNEKKEDRIDKKDLPRKNVELRADKKNDKKENRSLGGIKKKVTDDDDKMISNLMASNENKVEIPVLMKEIPAGTMIDPSIKEKNGLTHVLGDEEKISELVLPSSMQVKSHVEPLTDVVSEVNLADGVNASLKFQSDQFVDQAQFDLANAKTDPEFNIENDIESQSAMASNRLALEQTDRLALEQTETSEIQSKPQVQNNKFDLEAQLGVAVGFTKNSSAQQATQSLLDKLKTFDSAKNAELEKSQNFELNVFDRLKNEHVANSSMPVAKPILEEYLSGSNEEHSDSKNSDFAKDDLKSMLSPSNELHQASGQTHTEFKSQLGVSLDAQEKSLTKLNESRDANVNEIMQQAQYLVKKGGGEVSVKMSPEGMGEVQLKVLLQDGKLNIEMQTQNKDVKKLIEDSLSELKSGLSAHRISLEHIKVDSVSATNTENNMQFQSNLNQGGSEKNARELWNDLQGNGNFLNHQLNKKSGYATSSNVLNRSSLGGDGLGFNNGMSTARTYGGTKGVTVNRVA